MGCCCKFDCLSMGRKGTGRKNSDLGCQEKGSGKDGKVESRFNERCWDSRSEKEKKDVGTN